MAAAAAVDASLWWDPFSLLLTDLENYSISSDLPTHIVKKLSDNHSWFLATISRFKPPNENSREALNSQQVNVGSHQLVVKPELKEAALKISSVMCLDEVQAYILVKRSMEQNILAADFVVHEVLHVIMLQYYIERQCLLKCTRQLIVHALNIGTSQEEGRVVKEEARKLISGGLENQLLLVLQDLLSASYPDHMDGDLFSLWAEEILIEDNLILEILFLAYYESYCTCSGKQWRELCLIYERIITGSSNFPKLAISAEALRFINHAKVQLLLILIETLDLENLLQMVHDGTPFSADSASFSLSNIQDMDSIISSINAFEVKEAGPLILSWAVFLCLISSLPKTQETNMLMDFDHVAYVRQSFEAAALNSVDEILQSDILKDSDGPFAGYRSVLRTFVSAFIASYEISLQLEDRTLILILDILCKIYQGEESLCMQFWDRDSFIDGPIRCLLCNLEGEFPYRTVELVRLLSALSEGTWPAECVYNFLDKSVGVSSLFEINNEFLINAASQNVETRLPLRIPGVEGMVIPRNTRGHVLKVIDENTVLVRWEYAQSGVLVLLLRLAQNLYLDSTVEVLATLNLLSRLVSYNMAICFSLLKIGNSNNEATHTNRQVDNVLSFNVVDIICSLIKKISPDRSGALMMSMSVNILANMLKCFPSQVIAAVVKINIFDVALSTNPFNVRFDGISSGPWLLSGKLANLLLIDCEHNDSCCALTLSVLDFTMQLVETEAVNDVVQALLVFSLQYVFVNHTYWKYKVKHARWRVTLKVLEIIKKCISSIPYCGKMGEVIRDLLFCDSSIHTALFRLACTTSQDLEKIYISRLYEMMEIEGIQSSISVAMDILHGMLSNLSQDLFPSLPVFHQTVLSSATKPIPVINAMIFLLSCVRSPKIQAGAAKVLSILFGLADSSQSFVSGNACFGLDEKQITYLRQSIGIILCEESSSNEDLRVATLKLLAAATHYQPAFLVALIAAKGNTNVPSSYPNGVKQPNETDGLLPDSMESSIMVAVVKYVSQSADLFSSKPHILLAVLNFLEGLWRGAGQFTNILDWLRNSDHIWRHMSNILEKAGLETSLIRNSQEMEVHSIAYRCQCQSAVLQILAYESFIQKKLLLAKQKIEDKDNIAKPKDASLLGLKNALLTLHESSILGDLIKSYASCAYDNNLYLRGKSASALFSVHMMEKLNSGDVGSLSVSLTEKIYSLSNKLTELPAFLELVAQYAQRGYSEGNKLQCLVLQDLFYHLEGELEGREVAHGPFKELCQYLLKSDILKVYQQKYEGDLFVHGEMVYLFDLSRLRTDLGLDTWDYSQWKASKTVAESMLLCLEDVNSMLLLTSSSLSALKFLTTILITIMEDSGEMEVIIGKTIPTQLVLSSIDRVCHCLQDTIDLLASRPDASEDIIGSLEAQAELLLHLVKYADKNLSSHTCVLVLKTSGSGLKLLSDLRAFLSGRGHAMKLLLMLFLLSIKSSSASSGSSGSVEMESVDACANASNLSLGMLPILCNCIESDEHCTLSLTIIDFILRGFTMPNSWLPTIKKHLNLQHLILKLRDKSSLAPIILKFLLTLARVRDGAAMLFTAGFLPSVGTLFGKLAEINLHMVDNVHKKECLWRHGLAVIVAMVHSLQDTPFCADIVDYVITYFFLEKVELISYYLTIPDFTNYDEKRAWSQKKPMSLSALKDKENTLLLICELAKHSNSWMKSMKQVDSELRERNIHLLAFISRGIQSFGENPLKTAPLVCQPILKEEVELFKKPSFVNSRIGWFALSSLGCGVTPVSSLVSSRSTALVFRDQGNRTIDPALRTCFSDTIAIQIYRIAILILKFLCLQAESAVKRAEEVGFVDLVHFPELPMPDILHGLQDQGISIVTELCEANKMRQVPSEVQGICVLLVQITEMSLHLEFCVSQICGIRPVSGHVEDFSKKLRLLFKATEGHAFLKGLVPSLRNIVAYLYPGLLQTDGFL